MLEDELLLADRWPGALPPVMKLAQEGLDLSQITILVGENGTGKSTLVEAIAMAYGLNAEGGSPHAQHVTSPTESSLHTQLKLIKGISGSRWGYFLRAETMHGLYTYLDDVRPASGGMGLHQLSHGESFLEILRKNFTVPGLYVLDEPESGLSFEGCLIAVAYLLEAARNGGQLLIATHSPVISAIPGAKILELNAEGWVDSEWAGLSLVDHFRRFLCNPEGYLRHLS